MHNFSTERELMPDSSRSWQRVDGIDLIRGLAIFFVLMNHVNIRLLLAKVPYTLGIPKQLVSSLVWNGQFGVQMFFAVSGFLITTISLRRWGSLEQIRARDFYLMRVARIAPLLLLLLLVLSAFHFANVPGFVVSAKQGGLGRALFSALTFHLNLLEGRLGYLPAPWDILWSLSVEEMFYLFFPIACLLLARRKLLVPLLCCFVALGPFARTVLTHGNDIWQEKSYLGGMDAIALGCLAAMLSSKVPSSQRARRVVGMIGIALVAFVLCFSRTAYRWELGKVGIVETVLAVGTCLVIIVATQSGWRAPRALSPLLDLGQRSYEVYLTHMFVVLGMFGIFVKMGKPMALVPVLFVVTILVAAILGDVAARCFSEPMNRRLRTKWGDSAEKIGAAMNDEAATDLNPPTLAQNQG
jgi:peptidoglycan/LPS O-acetylase OafA/YrhL